MGLHTTSCKKSSGRVKGQLLLKLPRDSLCLFLLYWLTTLLGEKSDGVPVVLVCPGCIRYFRDRWRVMAFILQVSISWNHFSYLQHYVWTLKSHYRGLAFHQSFACALFKSHFSKLIPSK